MEKLIITPRTKIHDLLEAYPFLEEVLINLAPPFRKLKNPVLRKTIARVTSLNQAASIGGIKVEELVNRLRQEVGQDQLNSEGGEEGRYTTRCPEWFDGNAVKETLDIGEMLEKGEQPLYEVMALLGKLEKEEILEILAPFLPAPLIDKSLSLGYRHWVDRQEGQHRIYFSPDPSSAGKTS